jgi:hypothetical protein
MVRQLLSFVRVNHQLDNHVVQAGHVVERHGAARQEQRRGEEEEEPRRRRRGGGRATGGG